MNKAERAAYLKVAALLDSEGDRRGGAFGPGHPYSRELSRAWVGLIALHYAIERHRALAAKWKAQRKAKR